MTKEVLAAWEPASLAPLVELSSDVIVVVDEDGVIMWVNHQVLEMLGWRPDDLVGRPVEVLVPSVLKLSHVRHRQGFGSAPAPRPMAPEVALLAVHANGTEVPVDISLTPFCVGDRNYVAAAVRDATARRAVRQELEDSRAHLRLSLDSMLDAFARFAAVRVDGEIRDFVWEYVNEAGAKSVASRPEDLLGTRLSDTVADLLSSDSFPRYVDVVESGRVWAPEPVRRHRDGAEHVFELRAWRLGDGLAVTWRDITDRIVAVARLRESEERLQTVIATMPDALSVFEAVRDEDGTIVDFRWMDANRSASIVTGYPAQDLVGRRLLDVFPEQAAAGMLDVYRRVTETGQPYAEPELWYEDTWGDGQRARRCFDVRASRVGDGFMVLTRDVTSDREREQELARRQRGLERSNSELRQLNELSELLAGCQSADEAFHVFAGVAHRLFPVQGGALSWIRDSREEVEAVAGWARGAQVRSFDPLSCWAIRRGQQHVSTDDVPICPHFRDQAVEHGLCVPMAAQGQTVGVLHLIATDPRVLDPALQQLAATAAAQLSLAISNLELRETLRGLAIRDPLTGLFNRRYMEETLSRELARAAREEEVLTLLQLDVDHFKRFNDDYGHDAGDAVLRALSQVLRAVFRDSDVVCRFGGEEFTVVCPGVDEVGARARYRELQTRLDALRLPFRDKVLPPVTVSAGAAHYPRHAHEADDLMRLADQALYAAKRGGRDQLVVADLAPPP